MKLDLCFKKYYAPPFYFCAKSWFFSTFRIIWLPLNKGIQFCPLICGMLANFLVKILKTNQLNNSEIKSCQNL